MLLGVIVGVALGQVPRDFDCPMRQLALDYARKLQPFRGKDSFVSVADALNSSPESQHCNITVPSNWGLARKYVPNFSIPTVPLTIYVATDGSDSNPGTLAAPLKSLTAALSKVKGKGESVVVFRGGTYFLEQEAVLTKEYSNLTIQRYQDEEVWLSGGIQFSASLWKPLKSGSKVFVADLSSLGVKSVLGFRFNYNRQIRARFPNADPEQGFGSKLTATWIAPTNPKPDIEIRPDSPFRNTSLSFQYYQLGIGGVCSEFQPAAGYWCGNRTEGGGARIYRVPVAMRVNKSELPHAPYANPSGAVVHAWHPGHWESYMFEVDKQNTGPTYYEFGWSKGGFQGARGNDKAGEFYVENIFEELDAPNEWFYNQTEKRLYWIFTNASQPPSDGVYTITNLKRLIAIKGTKSNPVVGVQLKGLTFEDTAYTYLDPHGMPSGGDWALQRDAAIFVEGSEHTNIESCFFERVDGNAVMISGYNRFATVQNSEFFGIGDTAIAAWGDTTMPGTQVPAGMGYDGTNGEQPRFTRILNNFVHELGIWEKQSSFYFQAKSCQTTIKGNIFFNGPRAGINFNDGFGGGSEITDNLLFNTCKESGDHGPFNSWDRQVYVTEVRTGTASVIKAVDTIHHNFVIANYNSQEAIDNDDGSAYYETFNNFLVYSGGGLKSDFGGHDNIHHNNIYAYVSKCVGIVAQLPGHNDGFYSNKCIMDKDGAYASFTCTDEAALPIMHDNQVFTPSGKTTECGVSLDEWQSRGALHDHGTTVATLPPPDTVIQWAKALLF